MASKFAEKGDLQKLSFGANIIEKFCNHLHGLSTKRFTKNWVKLIE